ncbi:MAG: hypothetical protein KBD55_00115 [Candidatus Pacebacteria bacterium]|nr:hypothetical protein [Candidatus Paceibacterota bacterium]
MIKKIFGSAMVLGFMLSIAFISGTETASAQTATFPSGCSSAMGYSVTTGLPCNGTSTATMGNLYGCSSVLGYSVTNGAPCSGGSVAISYLAGCTSIYGYSTITAAPCNGTFVATNAPIPGGTTTNPGLPTTGAGANTYGLLALLALSGGIAFIGLKRLASSNSI